MEYNENSYVIYWWRTPINGMHFIRAKHGYIRLFAGRFEGFEFKEYNGPCRLGRGR